LISVNEISSGLAFLWMNAGSKRDQMIDLTYIVSGVVILGVFALYAIGLKRL